eukprot:SAG31_NODE_2615_length_5371_cov_89.477238_7_plen_83_part_00
MLMRFVTVLCCAHALLLAAAQQMEAKCIGASAHAAAQCAQLLGGDSPISEALLSVRLKPATVTKAESVLLRLGFETVFDLRL